MKSDTPRNNVWLMAVVTLVFISGFEAAARVEENLGKMAGLSIPGNGRHDLSLTLVWYDTYRLLPGSFEEMAREVIRIYDDVGVEVAWEPGSLDYVDGVDSDPLRIAIVLLPTKPKGWGLKEDAMGVATFREGAKGSVYVFFPALIKTLELSTQVTDLYHPRSRKMVSRAMARVVSHELLHVMAPQYPHTKGGLMNGNMSKNYLERPLVHFDEVSARVLTSEILGKTQQSVVASRTLEGDDKSVVGSGSSLQDPRN